ncbi:MAG TPA: hypothetical protein VGL59_11300 [Polyangia bacterium]
MTGNRLLGNLVLAPTDSGFRVDSRCQSQVPCNDLPRVVVDTQLVDDVTVGGPAGVSSSGAVQTRISQVTSVGSSVGVAIAVIAANAGVSSDSLVTNALATDYKTAGFQSTGERSWGFDHCAAAGGAGPAFAPMHAHVTSAIAADPALGACLVALPTGSPLKGAGAGGGDIGANVTGRYQNGQVTAVKLWDPTTGAFPCGAVVAGVNDDPSQSCAGVYQRLHVGPGACPLP